MIFQVTDEDRAKIETWLHKEVYPKVVAEQMSQEAFPNTIQREYWKEGIPYAGAIGGDVTYQFTVTTVGLIFTVESWGHKLNLTDYDSW